MTADISTPTVESIGAWLTERVAEYVDAPKESIASDVPFGEYGLDSVAAFTVCTDIEDHLGLVLEPTVLWDHPTIDALSAFLVGELNTAR
ncbi:acyl carrier protein [Goodfellowiella coeruleoviolacea]|uniref:Phosphopantetheine attachment site n=1 Tax=Goodfellowiella coeruleoviolacea TaxID=334858 RepID=A0AAE3GMC9_9PSEU|nr:acyl carrier protein [Goodfellowiella coeruleoviolacea]MCP2170054.1 Phosphopantetheine attachment site [Goodfellowiella coeruleoviolacea]